MLRAVNRTPSANHNSHIRTPVRFVGVKTALDDFVPTQCVYHAHKADRHCCEMQVL